MDVIEKNWRRKKKLLVLVVTILLTTGTIGEITSRIMLGTSMMDRILWGKDSDDDGLPDRVEEVIGTNSSSPDTDGDYVSDGLEVYKFTINPLRIDTDVGGLDDFNEIFTYRMNPNDPSDDREFMRKIPDVEVRNVADSDGGSFEDATRRSFWNPTFVKGYNEKAIILSVRDPLVRWYAERTEIKWETDFEGRRIGKLYTDGKLIFGGSPIYGGSPVLSGFLPSFYFTHERRGACMESSLANHVILKLMGYKCILVFDIQETTRLAFHQWNEVYINGNVYVVDWNDVIPRDNFYEKQGWRIVTPDYNPEWYSDGDRFKKDTDGDYVNDYLEVERYRTNHLKIDTDDGGVDDFNEIFTYGMNPNDPNDDEEFMEKIPNVEVKNWFINGGTPHSFEKIVVISIRDPLLQWYAERTEIKWETDSEGRRIGRLFTDGTPIYDEGKPAVACPPSFYFTHERRGSCVTSSEANHVILKLMDYKCILVFGETPRYTYHQWNEVYIDGNVYVVDWNDVIPRDNFYGKNGWKITSLDYDHEWYKKPLE